MSRHLLPLPAAAAPQAAHLVTHPHPAQAEVPLQVQAVVGRQQLLVGQTQEIHHPAVGELLHLREMELQHQQAERR